MKFSTILVMAMLFIALPGCTMVQPDAGEEGVIIRKPFIFGHGGVDSEPVTTGMKLCAFSTYKVYYKVTPVQYKESFDDLITDDNNPVDFDLYAELQIEKGKTAYLHENFGPQWYENNISPFLRKQARDRASQYKTFDLAGNREVLNTIETSIQEELIKFIKAKNLPVKVNRIVMGKVTPPPAVLDETMKTAAQNQAILTQISRAKAEGARADAERQKANADEMYRKTFGMTVPEYLQLRKLEIEKEKIELIREKQNVTVILNEGGSGGIPATYPVK